MDPLADASNRLGALQPSERISSKRQRLEQLQSQQASFQHVVSAGLPWALLGIHTSAAKLELQDSSLLYA
jgi:hypothetical protein